MGALAASAAMLGLKVLDALFAIIIVIRELTVVIGTQLLAVRLLGYLPRPRISREAWKPFFGKAAIVALGTVFYHIQFQAGVFFIQFLRPEAELGAFAAATRPLVRKCHESYKSG